MTLRGENPTVVSLDTMRFSDTPEAFQNREPSRTYRSKGARTKAWTVTLSAISPWSPPSTSPTAS